MSDYWDRRNASVGRLTGKGEWPVNEAGLRGVYTPLAAHIEAAARALAKATPRSYEDWLPCAAAIINAGFFISDPTTGLREAERYAAEAILDQPHADPDDDAAIVARALLRLATL